jgi:BolA protein
MNRAERIRNALDAGLSLESLRIEDDSARHAGHAGAQPGGETHFNIVVVSAAFAGLNRVARQRLVNDLLADEFATGLHALSVRAHAPGEVVS